MTSKSYPEDVKSAARTLDHARRNNYQIQPLRNVMPDLDQKKGYQIAAAIRQLREDAHGERVVGRKIGFTNRNIWPEYNIDASNWSYMYEQSVIELDQQRQIQAQDLPVEVDITHLSTLEPRIEPEIILCLSRPISSSMSDPELLQSLTWISHGFEVVASIFPEWKFTAADTTAAFALHGLLLIGSKQSTKELAANGSSGFLEELSGFNIELHRNGEKVDAGKGSNVLGSPIKALRHLVELLEADEFNPRLEAGEIVTTGTLTRALPIRHDEVWSTKLTGIDLSGVEVKFKLQ